MNTNRGFTLIEVLVVIGILAILAAIVVVAINPARQFAQSRNAQRTANVTAILNAVGQNMVDNRGIFECEAGAIPTSPVEMGSEGYNIRDCIVPTYIAELPVDPVEGTPFAGGSYNTGYTIEESSELGGRIVISAPAADDIDGEPVDISVSR